METSTYPSEYKTVASEPEHKNATSAKASDPNEAQGLKKTSKQEKGGNNLNASGAESSEELESPQEFIAHTAEKLLRSYTFTSYHFTRPWEHIFITLSFLASSSNSFRFPVIASECGGVLFFVPYVLSLIFVTVPIIYLENALGQYSSLPPLQLFYRLCPAFGGIGFAMSLIAVFKSLLLSFSALDLFYAVKSFSAAVSSWSRKMWIECVYEGHSSCFDPYIVCNSASSQYYSKCYQIFVNESELNPNYTWDQIVIGLTATSEALRELPTEIYLFEKIQPPDSPSSFLLASSMVQQSIIAVIAMLGMRAYAKIAPFLVIFPLLSLLSALIFAFAWLGSEEAMTAIFEGLKPKVSNFLTLQAWGGALLHAVVATNLLDGSFITVASMKTFKNNFMRDTIIVVLYCTMMNIFSCLVIYAVTGMAAKLTYPESSSGMSWLWTYGQYAPYIILPAVFAKTTFGALILSISYFSMFIISIGGQILALEMIIMAAYVIVERLKYIRQETSRNLIVCSYLLVMFFYSYISAINANKGPGLEYFYFAFAQSVIGIFVIIVSIHLYKLKRLIVNLRTMLGAPPNKAWKFIGYPTNWYFAVCWYAVTPLALVIAGTITLFAAVNVGFFESRGAPAYITTVAPLIIVVIAMIIQIINSQRKGEDLRLQFKADLLWCPELAADRQQALFDERAARVI